MAVRGDNSLYFSTGLDNDGLKTGANEATGIVQGLAGTISKINPFAALALGAVSAFAIIASSAFKMMREFEQAMKEVETISAATQANFKGISAEVFALSKMSPDGPTKLAKAYYQIVSAGYDGAAGMRLLETASKAATAGVTNTETAADGITTVLNAFKIEASEADAVADAMFTTVRLGKTTFEQLSSTLSQAAPLAAATGFSYQELLAAVASLTKQGVPTAQAMTQIRSGIESVSEVLGDGAAKSMTLQNAFQAIYDKAGGSQTKLKELTGRMEAMSAILGVTGVNAEGAAKDLEALGDSAGSAEDAFKRMAGSNINEWAILGNKIKATTADIGSSILEISSGVAKFLNSALEDSDALEKGYEKQRLELIRLENTLKDTVEGSEDWNTVRDKILKSFPDHIGGIDGEKVSTQQLLGVLDKVNESYRERYKLQVRANDLKQKEEIVANIELNSEDLEVNFQKTIDRLILIGEKEGVELKIGYDSSIEEVEAELKKVDKAFDTFYGEGKERRVIKGVANEDFRLLKQYQRDLLSLEDELKDAQTTRNETASDNRKAAQLDLQDLKKREEAIILIGKAMKESDFANYTGSGIDKVDEAIESRRKITDQFKTIDQAKTIESLKPFLDNELEEIEAYAQKKFRLLNTGGGGTPDLDPEAYEKSLKDRQEQYETYLIVSKQIGEKAAREQFESLLKMGENFGEFLQNQLKETTSAARQQAIAVAAQASGLNLNRVTATNVSSLETAPIILDVKINDTSIDYIEREIARLTRLFDAASKEDRGQFEAPLKMWRERLKAAQDGTDKEEELYNDVHRALSEMTFQSLRDYVTYWKDRLNETEKGSDKEKEILGKIADANAVIWQKHITNITEDLSQISGSLRDLGADDMADLIDGLRNVGAVLEGIFKIIDGSATSDEKLMTGISAAIGLADMMISSAARRKNAETDYYNSVIAQQKEYNRLLNEQLRTTESASDNVFTTDYINQIEQGIAALAEANDSYQESLAALVDGQAVAGQRNAVDWNSVLSGAGSGAALGAAIGSVVPVIGTIIGGAIGAIGGAIAGIFGGQSREDTFTSLLGEYPELIQMSEDGVASLNEELARTLVGQELVNEATAILLEDALAWTEQIRAAKEQIAEVVDTLAGSLGDNLRNALVDAFQSGEDAAVAMGDTISQVLQDVLAQMIFDQIFAEQFKKLQEQMTESFDVGGDRTWVDDFARFFDESQVLTEEFNQALADARDIAQNAGFDVFGQDQSSREGLSGAITNITEDTANLLAGYLNALRIDVREGLNINVQSMQYLAQITINTGYLINIDRTMVSVDSRMATVERGILEFEAQG